MALRNLEMFEKAKLESEPEVITILRQVGFVDVRSGSEVEDKNHIDIVGFKDGVEWHIDVKDLSEKTRCWSRNYCLSCALVEDCLRNPRKFERELIACRLYEDGYASGEYVFFFLHDLLKYGLILDKVSFKLFNVDVAMRTISTARWRKVKLAC